MISHKKRFIFIHIPKCAGSSVKDYYFNKPKLDWRQPNYELLYGWCPKRRMHLQHATPKELIETELIPKEIWDSYFKFAFVRNPWDRAYSDYLWIQNDRNVKGNFNNYIMGLGDYDLIMNDKSNKNYRGDHLTPQVDYVLNPDLKLDFVGTFETLKTDIGLINQRINFNKLFDIHEKRNTNKLNHYSEFYTNSKKALVDEKYKSDIEQLNYSFVDKRRGLYLLKKYL